MGVDKNMLVEFLQARSKDLCVDVRRERDNHFLDSPLCNRVYSACSSLWKNKKSKKLNYFLLGHLAFPELRPLKAHFSRQS